MFVRYLSGNIAQGKRTQQSGLFPGSSAASAVDGNLAVGTNTSIFKSQCTITGSSTLGQWWYVDFGGLFAVYNVTVYPRNDACKLIGSAYQSTVSQ